VPQTLCKGRIHAQTTRDQNDHVLSMPLEQVSWDPDKHLPPGNRFRCL
jgi:hypothetical protein